MFASLGITREQLFGDVYASWLRDIYEKPSEETKQLFTDLIETGFAVERQLVLCRQRLGVHTLHSLAALLHRTSLTRLVLRGNALREAGGVAVARLVAELPQLTHLDMGSTGLGAGGASALGVALASHRRLAVLLLDAHAGDAYANDIPPAAAAALLEGCRRCHTLRTLDVSGNPLAAGESAPARVRAGGRSSSSSSLPPLSSAGTGEGWARGAPPPLRPAKAGPSGGAKGPGGSDPPAPSATEPATTRSPVELLEELIRHAALDKLYLRNVALRGAGALRLVAALHDNFTLTVLDLSDNGLPPAVGDALGGLLMERTSSKNQLALRGLFLNGNGFFLSQPASRPAGECLTWLNTAEETSHTLEKDHNGSGAETRSVGLVTLPRPRPITTSKMLLLSALSHDRTLTTLELDRCGLGLSAVRTLCRSLLTNNALQNLSLRENALCETAAVDLGRVLCHHQGLRRLALAGNRIKDEGACAMATVLRVMAHQPAGMSAEMDGAAAAGGGGSGPPGALVPTMSSLEMLDMQQTWLGDRGLIALGVALGLNSTLRVLLLHDNFFTDQGGEAFAALVEKNHALVRCQLGSTSVPYPVIARVQRVMERNRKVLERKEQDELHREVIALHYQNYKLEEARIELESLQDRSSGLKRALDQVDLQGKQDHSEYLKKCNELEEHIKNYTDQAARMKEQREALEAEAKKAAVEFEIDMAAAKEQLDAEVKQHERVEEEHRRVTAELEYWKNNSQERADAKQAHLEAVRKEMREWESQRKTCQEQLDTLGPRVRALEERAASISPPARKSTPVRSKGKSSSKSRKKSKRSGSKK